MTTARFAVAIKKPRHKGRPIRESLLLAGCATFVLALSGGPAWPRDAECRQDTCAPALRSKVLDDSSVGARSPGENTEYGAADADVPFSISVDGEQVDHSEPPARRAAEGGRPQATADAANVQRKTDVGLNAVDIQIKYDGLNVRPTLNIATDPIRQGYRAGESIEFLATANYPAFIARSEIRIHQIGEKGEHVPVAVIPVAINGRGHWIMADKRDAETGKDAEFSYTLRVYDADDRYDETVPMPLARMERALEPAGEEPTPAPGTGEDRTAFRNIPVSGGAVTVFGRNLPEGHQVHALGEDIPLDTQRSFVVQRIMSPGEHLVDVAVRGKTQKSALDFSRKINIPNDDWFYVALADLTVGRRSGDGGIEDVRPDEYDTTYTDGRLAFYLKGKIKGKYLLTAAGDTGHDKFENMFNGLDAKDPRQLLRRIDPDDYYPVYGDDSTAIEDAPTKGKFYVRLERGDSHVLWGNYRSDIIGTEFIRSERALYGASAVYRSEATTSFGERETEASLSAAQPDTLPQRDEFLGSGSFYWMKRQDITIGSETITLELRDALTGLVVERRTLSYGQDYTFDYMQGTLLLKRPVFSVTGTSAPVRDGALGGDNIYIIAQYEYTPVAGDVDGYSVGGRAQHWLSEKVRVGATGMNESSGDANQRAYGADIEFRHSENTFLKGEFAHSKGPGFGRSISVDGGLSLRDVPATGSANRSAEAWRVKGQLALEDVVKDGPKGKIGGHYQEKQDGFSTLSEQVNGDERIWGAFADIELSEAVRLTATYDDYRVKDEERYIYGSGGLNVVDGDVRSKRRGDASVSWQFDDYWKVSFGVSYTELFDPLRARGTFRRSGYNGERLDGGIKVEYRPDDDRMFYGFGQGTISRSGDIDRNDRIGVGTEYKLTEKIELDAEISYGSGGIGGLAAISYNPTADDQYYVGYRLDPQRAFDPDQSYDLIGTDRGAIVGGVKRKVSDTLSAFTEDSYDMFGKRKSLNQTYGVIYTPDAVWTVNAGFEAGRVEDEGRYVILDEAGNPTGQYQSRESFDRRAASLSLGYSDEERGLSGHVRGEARFDESDGATGDLSTYLFAAGLSWKTNPDWRLLANVEGVWSDQASCAAEIAPQNCLSSFHDGDYVEASLGYAYRPIANDRLNALFKYTWLYDLPGSDQVSAVTDDRYGPLQRSHILSADFTYDLLPWLSVGGKYGFRTGEIKYRERRGETSLTTDENWERSTAHLGIVRTDIHLVKKWDILLEGRVLALPDSDTVEYGALLALYRQAGDNFKVGVGYNFGRFSDDLRDATLDDEGVFLNVVGAF